MYCEKCSRVIGSALEPFGGYLCGNGHLICCICFNQSTALCSLCGDKNMRLLSNYSIHSTLKSRPLLNPCSGTTCGNGVTSLHQKILSSVGATSSIRSPELFMTNNTINRNFSSAFQNREIQISPTNVSVLNSKQTTVHSGISDATRLQMASIQENIRINAAKIIKLCENSTSASAHMQACNIFNSTTVQSATTIPTAPPMEASLDSSFENEIKNCINLVDSVLKSRFLSSNAVPLNISQIQKVHSMKIHSAEAVACKVPKLRTTMPTDQSNLSSNQVDKNTTLKPSYNSLLIKKQQLELSNQILSDQLTKLTEAIKLTNHECTASNQATTPTKNNKMASPNITPQSQEPQLSCTQLEQSKTKQKEIANLGIHVPVQDTKTDTIVEKILERKLESMQNSVHGSNKETEKPNIELTDEKSISLKSYGDEIYNKDLVNCLLIRNRILELENEALVATVISKSATEGDSVKNIVKNIMTLKANSDKPISETVKPLYKTITSSTNLTTVNWQADPETDKKKITALNNKDESVPVSDKIEAALSDNLKLLFLTNRTEAQSDVCMKNMQASTTYNSSSTESSLAIPALKARNISGSLNNYLENESSVLQDKICYRTECNHFKFSKQRSISVSTDSTPSLNLGDKHSMNQTKFLVMHEITKQHCISTKPENMAEKIMDKRMGDIMKTINEEGANTELIKAFHRPNELTHIKKPMLQTTKVETNIETTRHTDESNINNGRKQNLEKYSKVIEVLNVLQQNADIHPRYNVENNVNEKRIAELVSRSARAYYSPCKGPFVSFMDSDLSREEPAPIQFRIIRHPSKDSDTLSRLLRERSVPDNMSSYELNLWRCPISCPDTGCIYKTFLSDLTKHLVVDHLFPIERVLAREVKNFFVDMHVAFTGVPKIQMVYLLQKKIIDLGHSIYKDCLPLLVMTSELHLSDIIETEEIESKDNLKYLLIWVCGLEPGKYPLNITLLVWKHSGRYPACQIVLTASILPIGKRMTPLEVFKTGNCIALTPQQQKRLIKNNMLQLQLFIH